MSSTMAKAAAIRGMPASVRDLALKHKVGVRHEPEKGLYSIYEPGTDPGKGHFAESRTGAMARIKDVVRARGK